MNTTSDQMYEAKYSTTVRHDKLAVWVDMPNGEKNCIWDLREAELTPAVKSAIAMAFERGIIAGKSLMTARPFKSYLCSDSNSWGKKE